MQLLWTTRRRFVEQLDSAPVERRAGLRASLRVMYMLLRARFEHRHCYFAVPDVLAGLGDGDDCAGRARNPLASNSAALASRTLRSTLSSTMTMTR